MSRTKKPPRKAVSKSQRDKLLDLFNHRCAICGAYKPQVHHIDEDRSNNDDLNLLPLCPTCHVTDMHDPTRPPDRQKLRLFREYRDPSILTPEFEPIFRRLKFILSPETLTSLSQAHECVVDLAAFLNQFDKGAYYHRTVTEPLHIDSFPALTRDASISKDEYAGVILARQREALEKYRLRIEEQRDDVLRLMIEMLRYQPWAKRRVRKRGPR